MRALLSVVLASAFWCGGGLSVLAQSSIPQNSNQGKNDNQSLSQVEEKIYTFKEVTTKVAIKKRVEPSYTESARENRIEGIVVLKAVFSSNGKVTNIEVMQGLPYGLTKKAMEAARKIKFVPAIKDGRPVSQYIQIEYHFNLN
ncbi:MAG TPA: energy transducer TonB [Pyrinomonadaceae bacterium]|jgi:TonB family protein|nr:energy transducer TonB [Pyrinomonadaceae bacterium]